MAMNVARVCGLALWSGARQSPVFAASGSGTKGQTGYARLRFAF
jgi:hypothetical protein